MPRKKPFTLLKDEKIVKEMMPHPLAFYELYIIWVWVIVLALVFAVFGSELSKITGNPLSIFSGYMSWMTAPKDNMLIKKINFLAPIEGLNDFVSPFDKFIRDYADIGLWISVLLTTAVPVSVIRIEFKWGPVMLAVGVLSVAATVVLGIDPKYSYYFSILLSFGGMYLVELYRKAHVFYITNRRIVTEARIIFQKSNELSYDKINNIVLEQSIVGRLLGFGTIIPVTASGLGMGADAAAVTVGAQGSMADNLLVSGQVTGERSIQIPRTRSMYALFGVANPEEVRNIISRYMHEYVQAPYLMRMTEQLEDIKNALPRDEPKK
jgi:hypothetical protein